jgi:hypothetical protein
MPGIPSTARGNLAGLFQVYYCANLGGSDGNKSCERREALARQGSGNACFQRTSKRRQSWPDWPMTTTRSPNVSAGFWDIEDNSACFIVRGHSG